jgi:hypothetical protein
MGVSYPADGIFNINTPGLSLVPALLTIRGALALLVAAMAFLRRLSEQWRGRPEQVRASPPSNKWFSLSGTRDRLR